MPDSLSFSLYLSTFAGQWSSLAGWTDSGAKVFMSLHMAEEFDDTYCRRAEEACHTLANRGFRVIADVSPKTVRQFGCRDLTALAARLRLWALRMDYGFSLEEMGAIAEKMPIVLNASTVTPEEARVLRAKGSQVMAMHNFYPRPETGLDESYLLETTTALQQAGLQVLAFIPGDGPLRGPVYEGLPTLEAHRYVLPSAAFVDLALRFGMDGIFLADPGLSPKEEDRIRRFCRDGVIRVPAELAGGWEHLYHRVLTCRVDSPGRLIRVQESREYSCQGTATGAWNCVERPPGAITLDNQLYGRYAGEVQIIRSHLQADRRVNVIGQVPANGLLLLDRIPGGGKFMLVRP